jgi:dephospho-CoA kinase
MATRLRVGLTGGIASGKSTVEERFRELGVPVVNADDSSRIVTARGRPGLLAVAAVFGDSVLTADGELDRRSLRSIIFKDPARRKELEAILHPLIREDMERRAAAAPGPYVVLSIPLLIEGGTRDRVDRILVVDTDPELQLERLVIRDAVTHEEASAVLAAQASRAERLAAADDVLVNSATVPELRQSVERLHRRYLEIAAARAR